MTKIVNLILISVFAAGAFLAMNADAERRKLRAEFLRLSAEHGHFPIQDNSRIHVLRLESDDPMYFRFRIFLPANQTYLWKHRNGSSGGSNHSTPTDLIAQLRLRFDETKDRLMVFYSTDSGSGCSSIHSGEAGKFVVENWDRLEITSIDEGEEAIFDVEQVVELVRIEIPEELASEYEQRFPRVAKSRGLDVYHYMLGTPEAYKKLENAEGGG